MSQAAYTTKIQEYERETEELTLRAKQFMTTCNQALDDLTTRLAKISAIENNLKQLIATQVTLAENEWKLIQDKICDISNHTARLEKLKNGLLLSAVQMQAIQQAITAAKFEKDRRKKLLGAAEMLLDNIHKAYQ